MQPSTPTGGAHADRSSIVSFFNAQSYRVNNGLPPNGLPSAAQSMMMGGGNYHDGFPNFDYSRLSDGHQLLSQDGKNLNGERAWPMSTHSNMTFRQAVERSEVPELVAGPSTVSPSSTYFSGLSSHDLGFPSTPKQDHAVWNEYGSESPTVIKQSSSVMNSPTFPHSMPFPGDNSMHAGMSMPQSGPFCNTPWTGQSTVNVNGYGMSMDNVKLPWNGSMRPNGNMGQIDWPQNLMPQDQRSKNAVYHTLRSAPPNQQTSSNEDSNRRQSSANQSVVRSREIQAPRPNEVAQGISGRVGSEEQRQRKRQDDILRQGKNDGLTYKEIRALIGTDIAESTLRGRWRSLSKLKRDRVRKPVWTHNDVSSADVSCPTTPSYRTTY